MKFKFYFLIAFCLLATTLQAQESSSKYPEMKLLSNWQLTDSAVKYNDIWGYAADGREYAIIGSSNKTNFVDITNPTDPRLVASFWGSDSNVIWRDFKTYSHYAYAVADGGQNSLQVFDLQHLPERVEKVYDSNIPTLSAHNIFVDNGKLYLISNRSQSRGYRAMDVYSLANPAEPAFLGTFQSDYYNEFHDVYVKNDTAYCSAAYKGFVMFDVKDINNPVLLGSIPSYAFQGYNHSSWTTPDSKILIMTDEVPQGYPIKIFDISDFSNPQLLSTFQSTTGSRSKVGSTPHNPFVYGNYIVISYYHDGVQVYDISDPRNPVRAGFYDTYPENTNFSGFQGCWGVYPYLPSGNIIASDITHGLFVLMPPYELLESDQPQTAEIYPNPSEGIFQVKTATPAQATDLKLYSMTGQVVQANFKSIAPNTFQLEMPVKAGLYILRVGNKNGTAFQRVVIQR